MEFPLDRIDHVALSVRDLEKSLRWYEDVLGFERAHEETWGGEPTFVRDPGGRFALALFPAAGDPTPMPDIRILHLAFGTSREGFKRSQETLRAKKIPFHFVDHEVCKSIYFEDLDGHELEITTYEIPGAPGH